MTPELRHGLYAVAPEDMGVQQYAPLSSKAESAAEPSKSDTQQPQQAEAGKGGGKGKARPKLIPLEVQRLFARLQMLQVQTISTEDLTTKGFKWQDRDGRVQHDVHELNRLLIDALERSLAHTPSGAALIPTLYTGQATSRVTCLSCGRMSDRDEAFQDLMLMVNPGGDSDPDSNLVSALAEHIQPEAMVGENQYWCERCDRKVDGERRQMLRELPPLLVFSLNRFQFDMKTMERVKVSAKFEFPLVLDTAPFVNDQDGLYDLLGVVLHRGSAYSGHYHAYIRDCLGEGAWSA
ncbi:hypothetical protein JKP88DRAFT_181783, partial [Tribonema minus]